MKRLLLLSVTTALLFIAPAAGAVDLSTDLSVSLRNSSDDVNFNIAADLSGSVTPNVLSDVRWDDVEIWALHTDADFGIGKHFKIGVQLTMGAITDGDALDSDYLGDARTLEFSRASATVDGDYALSGDINIGWTMRGEFEVPLWHLGDGGKRLALASVIEVTPRIGYFYSKHKIEFEDGVQLIPDLGPFEGLSSNYEPEWKGLHLGTETSIRLGGKLHLLLEVRYWPSASYRSDANWNLRSDLSHPTSFSHSADGSGSEVEGGLEWRFSDSMSAALTYGEKDFDTDPGTDQVILADGESLFTRLNKAEWRSRSLGLQFSWMFGD